jgi:predicted nucleotidyltransferase
MPKLEIIKETLSAKKSKLRELGISRIGVFGSTVRGEACNDSDIDILIDLAEDNQLTYISLIELEQKLSEELNSKVDLVIQKDLKPNIGKKILEEVEYV